MATAIPPIPTLATSTLFSSFFLSNSLYKIPIRIQSLNLYLCSRLEAVTVAGGDRRRKGANYLRASMEAIGEKGNTYSTRERLGCRKVPYPSNVS